MRRTIIMPIITVAALSLESIIANSIKADSAPNPSLDKQATKLEEVVEDRLLWKVPINFGNSFSSPVIGEDGTIYIGSNDYNVYAINPDGTERWKFPTNKWVSSSPAIAKDGTIYIGSNDYNVYAINPDGTERWKFPTGGSIRSTAAIAKDAIYVGSKDGYLYAINKESGIEEWKFLAGGEIWSTPAIAKDGTIYFGANNWDDNFYAINPDGTIKWAFPTERGYPNAAAIGKEGTIYFASDKILYGLNPEDGSIKLRFEVPSCGPLCSEDIMSSPVIDSDGSIYFASRNEKLYRINPDGAVIFTWEVGALHSSPLIGSDGTAYIGSIYSQLFAVDKEGGIKWSFITQWQPSTGVESSPTINNKGIIYFGCQDGYLYAINSGTNAGLANTPWPMFGQNPRHTSNAADYKEPVNVQEQKPLEFSLNQNYPNPFNPTTTISYNLPSRSNVRLDVFNSTGQYEKTLVDRMQEPGRHDVLFDATNWSSGLYLYRLTTPMGVKTNKMTLVK